MQNARLLCALALLVAPAAAAGNAVRRPAVSMSALELDLKEQPVVKVVAILKDMLKTMEKEQEEDEEIYNKLACWCETNDREKTKSIAEAEAKIEALTTQIEELTQLSAQLSTEIKNTEKEVSANQAALDKATAIRQKQLAEFNAEEKDMLQSIAALKGALAVLSKHHSLLQMPRGARESVTATMKREMEKHALLLEGVLSGAQKQTVTAFIQAKASYAPQSGEVYGILEQMKETFDADLSETQKEEAANLKAYEELKAAKESEIAAGQEQIDMKTQALAKTDESNANAKQDLEDTKNSLSADEQFLMNLKEHCSMTDKEWEERTKTRQLEMEACSKAMAILNSDDSHDLFTKTFSFVQKRVTTNSKTREQASKVVADVASKNRSPQLAALAVRIRLDAFTRVKKAIDDMVAMLLKEQEDEIKQKDFCVDEFHTNEVQTTNKDREKEDLLQKIEELTQLIKELTEAIATLKAEIAELQKQIKYAGEDREKANQEFQTTIADQRETQKVLAAALKFLTDYYGKTAAMDAEKTVLMQQTPPAAFKKFEDSKSSGGVMDMIQNIINDAKTMEAETIRAEEDAQKAYEDFVKESNASIEAKTEEMVNKSELKAQTEAEKVATIKAKDNVLLELEQLANYNAQLHSSCDFVLKNFELRQKARAEEVEALRTAKQILSGAKFQEFLQR